MSQSIVISETNIPANANGQLAAINNTPFNPVERTSSVSVYAVSSITQGVAYSLQIAGVSHGEANAFLNAGLTLSTRDNLILQGIAIRGQKIGLNRRELTGVATTDTEALVVIQPL